MVQDPGSPRSVCTNLSSSPPTLDPTTIALLDSFWSSKAEEERRFNDLAEQAAARAAGLAWNLNLTSRETKVAGRGKDDGPDASASDDDPPMMSVDEYRLAFGEDWQLSQFWYSTPFATRLAKSVRGLCAPDSVVAFLCCPTAFVAFQHANPLGGARLLEYDQRFRVLSPRQYVPYDLDEPDIFPEVLRQRVDVVVVDPPYLNERTNAKLVTTIKQILKPAGKLLLVTSSSIEDVLMRLYGVPPLGPLRTTALEVQHGRLANDFVCWGSWDGAEDFGKDID